MTLVFPVFCYEKQRVTKTVDIIEEFREDGCPVVKEFCPPTNRLAPSKMVRLFRVKFSSTLPALLEATSVASVVEYKVLGA